MAIRFIFEHDVVVDERPRRTFTLLPGKGVKGDKGDPGNGLTVKDVFDTLAELEAAYPTGNEYAYQVIDEDREIFIWSANEGAWTSLGALEGPAGPQGKGISSYVEYYARSTSGTTAPADSAFSTTPPELTSTYKYMWSYALITLTDSTTITTSKHVVGAYGDKGDTGETGATGQTGATGKGISSYTEYFARGTSATTVPADADFSTTPPELTSTYKYMWSYTSITYSDNTSLTTAKHLIGAYGDKGDTGANGADGADGVGVPSGGTTGQVLKKKSGTNYDTEWANESSSSTWGSITGTLSDQTDLQNALNGKANTSDTYTKAQVDDLCACLIVDCGTISSLPATISNSSITSDMVAVKAEFGTPDAQLSDWTVTTSTGSVTISGTLISSGSTTLKLYLVKTR